MKYSFFTLIIFCLVYEGKSQDNDRLIMELGETGPRTFNVFNPADSTCFIIFTEGRLIKEMVYEIDHLRIVQLDKNGSLLSTKQMSIEYDEKIVSVHLSGNDLVILSNGKNKLKYSTTVQNKEIGIVRYFDLSNGKTIEYYCDQYLIGCMQNNVDFYLLLKELGCKNENTDILLSVITKSQDGSIKEKEKKQIDKIFCGANSFCNSYFHSGAPHELEYIKKDYEKKPNINSVNIKDLTSLNNYQTKYDYVLIDIASGKKLIKNICSACYLVDYQIISSEKSLLITSDRSVNKLLFYYNTTNKTQELLLDSISRYYRIYSNANETLLIGVSPATLSVFYKYLQDEKILWTKTSPLTNSNPIISCFFTNSNVIVTYIFIKKVNGKTKRELRSFSLKK